MRQFAAASLLLSLGGCAASGALGTIGAIGQQAPSILHSVDQTINSVILQRAADLHNLGIALSQINSTPGMVMPVVPPPVITAPSPIIPTGTPVPIPPPPTTTRPPIILPVPVPPQ